jgi:hypothetical protein
VARGGACADGDEEDPAGPTRAGPILRTMWLVCTRRCGGRLFRPLDAELVVDASGDYQEYRVVQPSYLCLNCGSPAVDLGAVPEAMAEDAEEDAFAPVPVDVLCPTCETRVSVLPGEECPNCGAALEVG